MSELVILVGPPGSGKSTYAKRFLEPAEGYNFVRVNGDEQKNYKEVFQNALKEGKDIVVDRMNFDKKQRAMFIGPAKAAGYSVEIVVFQVPKHVCYSRCMTREEHPTINGEPKDRAKSASSALSFFWKSYERPTPDEGVVRFKSHALNTPKRSAVVFDIDGTIADIEHRRHHTDKTKGKPNWKAFFDEMVNDTPKTWCVDLVNKMSQHYDIVFCSGRDDNYREHTEAWLNKHIKSDIQYELYMRPRNDYRKDNIIKEMILDFELLPRYDILFVVDDRDQVVKMWRERGLTCLQCDYGDF